MGRKISRHEMGQDAQGRYVVAPEDRVECAACGAEFGASLEGDGCANCGAGPLCNDCWARAGLKCGEACEAAQRGGWEKRLSPGDGERVQFRCARTTRLALLSRAQELGLSEREAWERAAREWADGG